MQQNFQLHISFTKDFEDTFDLFLEMIKHDIDILEMVKEENRKKGLMSPAIRYLISTYVEERKGAFLEGKKRRTNNDED